MNGKRLPAMVSEGFAQQFPIGRPLTPEEIKEVQAFGQAMEQEVIPEIVKAVELRQRFAIEARRRIL